MIISCCSTLIIINDSSDYVQFSAHNYGLEWESHALEAHQYTFLSELWVWLSIHNYTISLSCLSLVFLSHEFPCPYHVIIRYVQIPRLAISSVSIPHGVPCLYVMPWLAIKSLPCPSLPCHYHPWLHPFLSHVSHWLPTPPTLVSHAYTINRHRCRIPLHPW